MEARGCSNVGLKFLRVWLLMLVSGLLMAPIAVTSHEVVEVHEYCEWEEFKVTCETGHVIMVLDAKYGRMKVNRCVDAVFSDIGCGADVTPDLERACAGRQSCVVNNFVTTFYSKNPCPGKGFRSNLEVSYQCIKVATHDGGVCSNWTTVDATVPGVLASVTTRDTGLGTSDCPWLLTALPHQQINVTLLDFTMSPSHVHGHVTGGYHVGGVAGEGGCKLEYGVIEGREGRNGSGICGSLERQVVVFVSSSNIVQISINRNSTINNTFILKYQAFGCIPIVAPPNAWVMHVAPSSEWRSQESPSSEWRARDKLDAVIKCNDTDEQWTVTCLGTQWIGHVGNCSTMLGISYKSSSEWSVNGLFGTTYGILLVICLGVLIGVVAGVLMLLAVLAYMRSRRGHKIRSHSSSALTGSQLFNGKINSSVNQHPGPIYKRGGGASNDQLFRGCVNNAGTWQRTRPLPIPVPPSPGEDNIAMSPLTASSTATQLPLLLPYSLDGASYSPDGAPYSLDVTPFTLIEGGSTPSSASGLVLYGPFGQTYNELVPDLARRQNNVGMGGVNRMGGVVGMGGDYSIDRRVDEGQGGGRQPYYFRLDSSSGRVVENHQREDGEQSGQHLELNPHCMMCHATSTTTPQQPPTPPRAFRIQNQR